jgi:hypothetical protein
MDPLKFAGSLNDNVPRLYGFLNSRGVELFALLKFSQSLMGNGFPLNAFHIRS